jgi:hypothetical protein
VGRRSADAEQVHDEHERPEADGLDGNRLAGPLAGVPISLTTAGDAALNVVEASPPGASDGLSGPPRYVYALSGFGSLGEAAGGSGEYTPVSSRSTRSASAGIWTATGVP